jgi:hypothetical protein
MPSSEVLLQIFSDLDRHFGRLMEKLSGGDNPDVFLAAALASRSSREGHVCLDLAEFAGKPLVADLPEEPGDEDDPGNTGKHITCLSGALVLGRETESDSGSGPAGRIHAFDHG